MNNQSTLERYLLQQQGISGELLYVDAAGAALAARTEETAEDAPSKSRHIPILKSADVLTAPEPSIIDADMKKAIKWQKAESLEVLQQQICNCQNCELGSTRTKFVFGVGNSQADIVVIGEAPGADEDAQGEPFVGRAGQLLTKILEAVHFQREDVFIANILKCRPPGNRTPVASEVDECEPYLYKQLELIQPTFILALGLTAVNTLLKSKFKMADVRGKFFNYQNVRMMVTYHPAALLRNPEWKKSTWEDVQRLRAAYDAYKATGALPEFSVP